MDAEQVQRCAVAVKRAMPENHGFLLLMTEFKKVGEDSARLNYTSNIERKDAIAMLKEFFFRIGEAEDWMKRIE